MALLAGMIMVAVALVASTAAAAERRGFVDASRHAKALHSGWARDSGSWPALDADVHEVEFTVALALRNVAELERTFWDVSSPSSPRYGRYLSVDELAKLTAPSADAVAAVERWLGAAGLRVVSRGTGSDMLVVRGPVRAASVALGGARFERFAHAASGARVVRTLEPFTLPASVVPHVAYVSGVHGVPAVWRRTVEAAQRQQRASGSGDDSAAAAAAAAAAGADMIGPAEIRARYNVSVVGSGGVKQSVVEFQGQYYDPFDLKKFFAKFVPGNTNDTVAKVVGENQPRRPGGEASLDIQYIMGVAPNQQNWFYCTSEFDFWDGLAKWATAVSKDADAPIVHSLSYGDQSIDQPGGAYKDRMNQSFMKMGARGLSIVFASGDSGSGCDFCVYLEPSFPATSPYVTSVGATRFMSGTAGAEAAVEEFHSGGGFSWHYPRPAYQDAAVAGFLANNTDLPSWFRFNKDGRATPDVAALGIGYSVYVDGGLESIGGTSASAPTFAALLSLLNDLRAQKSKAPLGFVNPLLYQTWQQNGTAAFFDVTVGDGSDGCCFTGFKCRKGYDAVTGVGTPNFAFLQSAWV